MLTTKSYGSWSKIKPVIRKWDIIFESWETDAWRGSTSRCMLIRKINVLLWLGESPCKILVFNPSPLLIHQNLRFSWLNLMLIFAPFYLDDNHILLGEILCEVYCCILTGTRLADQNVPEILRQSHQEKINDIARLLSNFGKALLSKKHVRDYLTYCMKCGRQIDEFL